ncbi:cell surface protein [Lasiosphaeria hispida]|uniref:Cell surface protein n=1 Tax=Lasiosphaeria hispida TaxID=260671 RepID=A0AAJ0M903_9PEZI|nr:cell surface protein [Lasiosphaeria hispida]
MPLYIYPLTRNTWKPLYDAIAAHPSTEFLVIVNPNSGPGDGPLPGHDYVREVPRLNAFPNVRTVGYVAIDYCRKPLLETCKEIGVYAGWYRDYRDRVTGLYVEGIYMDETPNHADVTQGEYLARLRQHVKEEAEGLRGERLVIQNPGTPTEYTITSPKLLSEFGNPDLVCVSEVPYSQFLSDEVQTRLATFPLPYDCNMFQISAIPHHEMAKAAADLCKRGRYVFATDLTHDFYESFGESWMVFVGALATVATAGNMNDASGMGDARQVVRFDNGLLLGRVFWRLFGRFRKADK